MRAALILILFACGLICGFVFDNIVIGLVGGLLSIISMWIAGRMRKNPVGVIMSSRIFAIAAIGLFFSLGFIDAVLQRDRTVIRPQSDNRITAIVESRKTLTSGEVYNLSMVALNDSACNSQLTLFTSANSVFRPGEILSIRTVLKDTSPGTFSRRQYIARGDDKQSVTVIGESRNPRYIFMRWRDLVDCQIGSMHIDKDAKELLRALLIADRSGIDRNKTDILRNGGAIHALAVSGMHIGIIAAIFMLLTVPLGMLAGRKLRFISVLIAVWIFVLITGCGYSSVRAALMLSIATAAWILERKRDAFSAVCFAALLILAVKPYSLSDVGLQLSFVSVAALCLFARQLNPIDHRRHPITYKLFAFFLATLIATAATWMLCGYHFGNVPVRFLPANIILLPMLPIYMIIGIAYLFLTALGFEMSILVLIIESFPKYLYLLLDRISSPSVAVNVGVLPLALWMGALTMGGIAINLKADTSGTPILLFNREYNMKQILIIISVICGISSIATLTGNI